jgi:hypothetical protein
MSMRFSLICLFAALSCSGAWAETCKYIDKNGHTIYSNVPIKNARKVSCFQPPPTVPDVPARDAAPPQRPATAPADAGRTRVDADTQRRRDDERRRILEDELAREQVSLNEARQTLAEQEAFRSGDERNYQKVLERLKPYQDAVAMHERNVAAIRQELANLK